MATLENIRKRGVLLLVVIGVALLAFIIGDFLNSGSTVFQQSQEEVAEVNGQVIKIQEYENAINQLTDVYRIEYNMPSLDDAMSNQVRQSVWQDFVSTTLLKLEAEEIGLVVNSNELKDITIGNNPSSILQGRRAFTNPSTGMFDKGILLQFLASLDEKPTSAQQLEGYNVEKNYWMYFENLVKVSKLQEKYINLLSRALNVNSLEAKMSFEAKKTTADLAYVMKPYYTVADDKVAVSEQEIEQKYNQIKTRYKEANELRDIKYVMFAQVPSQDDFDKTKTWMDELKPEFSTTNEITYVVNSNSKAYRDVALSANEIDADLKDFAFAGKKDDVFGPELFGNTYKMARVMETGTSSPDSLNLRHIVILEQTPERTQAVADSVLKALKGGAAFAPLAMQYSKMQTATQGGEIGWVRESTLERNMAKACLSHAVNEYFTVEDGSAIQVLQVTEKTKNVRKVKLAVIESEVAPSNETYSKIYSEAKEMAALVNNNLALFEKSASEKGYVVMPSSNLDKNAPMLGGMKNSRQVIRWAFEKPEGSTSDVFECEGQFVVAAVSAVYPEGYTPLAKVAPQIKNMLMNEKKADYIISTEWKDMDLTNIEQLAAQANLPVDTAINVNFQSTTLGTAGFEPKAIVAAVYAEKDKVSAPIKGEQGVFVTKVLNKTDNPTPFDVQIEKTNLLPHNMQAAYRAQEALLDEAEIEDSRSRFY